MYVCMYVCMYKPENLYPLSQHTLLWVFSLDLLSSGESTFILNGGGWMKLKYFETSVPRLVCLVKSKTRKQKSLERDIRLGNAKFVGDLKPRANDATLLDVSCCAVCPPCCTLLEAVAFACTTLQQGRINTQRCWRNNVGRYCVR